MDGQEWGLVIQVELEKLWFQGMSATDRKLVEQPSPGDPPPSPKLFAKLDAIILQQAETLGWRLGLSELVRFRFSAWDHSKEGPELHRKFGAAVARSARIMQRRELPPVTDPEQWLVKKETVEELRVVLERLRSSLAIRSGSPSREAVDGLFASIVTEAANSFPHLAANLDRWRKFYETNPDTLIRMVTSTRATPATLYDDFLSWSTGWEPEALRQAISRLGRAKL